MLIKLLLPISLCVLISCSTDQTGADSMQESLLADTTAKQEDSILTQEEEILDNDWKMLGLKGKVSYLGSGSSNIDDEGHAYGMGGYSLRRTFDSLGYISKEESSGCCGAPEEQVEFVYNDKHQLTHKIFYSSDSYETDLSALDYYRKEKYFYSAEGVLVKMKAAGFNQQLVEEYIYSFDDKNQLIKEVVENDTGFITNKTTYKRGSNNLKTVLVDFERGDTSVYTEYFNLEGWVDKTLREIKNNAYQETRGEFTIVDSLGNWTEQIFTVREISADGTKTEWRNSHVITRSISYFAE